MLPRDASPIVPIPSTTNHKFSPVVDDRDGVAPSPNRGIFGKRMILQLSGLTYIDQETQGCLQCSRHQVGKFQCYMQSDLLRTLP